MPKNHIFSNFRGVHSVFEPFKRSENNFVANRKFSSCDNVKILCKLWEKYMLFSLYFMNRKFKQW